MNEQPVQAFEEDEIDIIGILKYLWDNIITIVAIGLTPIFLFILLALFKGSFGSEQYLSTVIKISKDSENFVPSSIINESIINQIIEERNYEFTSEEIIPALTVVNGFESMNEDINNTLSKLSGETSINRGESMENVRLKYENLIATQSNFLTLSIHLNQADINQETAKLLLSQIVEKFNAQFADGLIPSSYVLTEVDLTLFENLGKISPLAVNNLQGIQFSLRDILNTIKNIDYNKGGFNIEMIEKRLNYVDYELRRIIGADDELMNFFFEDLKREIGVEKKKIASINEALSNLSAKNYPKNLSGQTNGAASAEYNAEIFDRFLNLGATVSLVEFQQQLLEQKIDLEFSLSETEENLNLLRSLNSNIKDKDKTYQFILNETKSITSIANEFVTAYNQNYQVPLLTIIQISPTKSASWFQLKIIGVIAFASFGLSFLILLIKKGFTEST